MTAPTIESLFEEWKRAVYGQELPPDQAQQIEMAFFSGVVACRTVIGRADEHGGDIAAHASITGSLVRHIERVRALRQSVH